LKAQEEERKRISRELHDVIAQTLTGINVRLANLKKEAAYNTKGLGRKIARTQQLVEHSVNIVHQFARELRPTALDDLGLIPALHTFMKGFKQETGIQVSLSAEDAVEQVDGDQRTVLYRVAQEALHNIARHAHASHAHVIIQKQAGAVCLKIEDDGKGFEAERAAPSKKDRRLGLLGMRERVEMVNGRFRIESTPGKGTTIIAEVPLATRGGAEKPGPVTAKTKV
jgi:signal transduction histidine kinase